jgi:hypothetical protein
MPDKVQINSDQLQFQPATRINFTDLQSAYNAFTFNRPRFIIDTATHKPQTPTGLVFHNLDCTSCISANTAIFISGVLANELVTLHHTCHILLLHALQWHTLIGKTLIVINLWHYEINYVDTELFWWPCKNMYIVVVILNCCCMIRFFFCMFRCKCTDDARTHHNLNTEGCNVQMMRGRIII